MKLEKWTRSRHYRLLPNQVSISGSGSNHLIRISRELEKNFTEPEVELWFDEKEKIIALKPVKYGSGFKVGHENKEYPYMFIKPSLALKDLQVKNGRYTAWVEEGMVIFKYEIKIVRNKETIK